MTEQDILDKYLGVKYRHLGRDLKGLDCWGLICLIYRDIGITILDLDKYEERWNLLGKNYFVKYYYTKWKKQKAARLLDVLLFWEKGVISHAGVYLSAGKFIHSTKRTGVVVSRVWKYNLEGIYRYDKS